MAQYQVKESKNEIEIVKINGRISLFEEKLSQVIDTIKENADLLNGVIKSQQSMLIQSTKFDKDLQLIKKVLLGFCSALSLILLQKFTGLFDFIIR